MSGTLETMAWVNRLLLEPTTPPLMLVISVADTIESRRRSLIVFHHSISVVASKSDIRRTKIILLSPFLSSAGKRPRDLLVVTADQVSDYLGTVNDAELSFVHIESCFLNSQSVLRAAFLICIIIALIQQLFHRGGPLRLL